MTPPRRAKLVLLVLAIAIVGLSMWAWEPVYWWVMTERVYFHVSTTRGWMLVKRGTKDDLFGPCVVYYVDTGFKKRETEFPARRVTVWNPDGTVLCQFRSGPGLSSRDPIERKGSSPWWWGVTDQTSPSMPEWMKDDAKWAKALEEQGQ